MSIPNEISSKFGKMSSGLAELKYDDQGFEVKVEVKAFALEELKVKIEDNNLKVYGEDVYYHGHRCFLQKCKDAYTLRDDLANFEFCTRLNAQGILTITGTKLTITGTKQTITGTILIITFTKSTMSTAQPLIRDVPITQE